MHIQDEENGCPEPNFGLVLGILNSMESRAEELMDGQETVIRNIFDDFLQTVTVAKADKYLEIYDELETLVKSLIKAGRLLSTKFLDDVCPVRDKNDLETNWTVFSKFCRVYQTQDIKMSMQNNTNDDISREECRHLWQPYLRIFQSYNELVKPRLTFSCGKNGNFHALLTMARAGDDFQGLEYLMERADVDVSVEDKDGIDGLYILIERGCLKGIRWFLNKGSNVNRVRVACNEKGLVEVRDTPLLWAIQFGRVDVIRCLLDSGASVSTKAATEGISAVHRAVIRCSEDKTKANLEIVRLLLEGGADVNETDQDGRTPLHIAVNNGNDKPDSSLDLEMLLLRKRADTSITDSRGRTALHYAFVKIGRPFDCTTMDPIQVVGALVENLGHADINVSDKFGCTALHYAGYRGSTVCSLLLLQHGADIEAADLKGQTPLCYAVLGRHDSSTLMLIQKDANINVEVYSFAKKKGNMKSVEDGLFKHLAKHYKGDDENKPQSLFHRIVINDWLGIIYVMLDKLEAFGIKFVNALEVAFLLQKLQFAKTLVGRVVDDNKLRELTAEGRNLISEMAFQIRGDLRPELCEDLLQLLLSAGLDPFHVDSSGGSALHYASFNHNKTLVELILGLENSSDFVRRKTTGNRDALAAYMWNTVKASQADLESIKLLLSNGLNVNEKFPFPPISFSLGDFALSADCCSLERFLTTNADDISVSPLILAVGREDADLVELLLEQGADVTVSDSLGRSPLVYALQTNNEAIIQRLIQCTDKIELGVLLHAVTINPEDINSPSFDNAKVFKKLLDYAGNVQTTGRNLTLLAETAMQHGASKILKLIIKSGKPEMHTNGHQTDDEEMAPPDYSKDAKMMLESLQQELDVGNEVRPSRKQAGCIVKEGHIFEDFDVLLNKVDVSFGAWGLYNFYRAQIWKEQHKDLYVLFTNWGRIQSWGSGQFQNTPYSTPQEAIAEFEKIFKAKTGNNWEDRDNFENKPKKYRIVKRELRERVKKCELKINLKTDLDTKLSLSLATLVRSVSDIDMLKAAYKGEANVDSEAIPFGRIDTKTVQRAKEDIDELKVSFELADTFGFESSGLILLLLSSSLFYQ